MSRQIFISKFSQETCQDEQLSMIITEDYSNMFNGNSLEIDVLKAPIHWNVSGWNFPIAN